MMTRGQSITEVKDRIILESDGMSVTGKKRTRVERASRSNVLAPSFESALIKKQKKALYV